MHSTPRHTATRLAQTPNEMLHFSDPLVVVSFVSAVALLQLSNQNRSFLCFPKNPTLSSDLFFWVFETVSLSSLFPSHSVRFLLFAKLYSFLFLFPVKPSSSRERVCVWEREKEREAISISEKKDTTLPTMDDPLHCSIFVLYQSTPEPYRIADQDDAHDDDNINPPYISVLKAVFGQGQLYS